MQSELVAGRADPSLLARPVLVVVPSASLRAHLASRLVERSGGAVAGLSIVTLNGLAYRILERAGERPPPGAALMPLLVRDLARADPILFERLDALVDGYGALEASVADLLDAGMEAVHAEALDERLAATHGASNPIARAVVRLAGRVAGALGDGGWGGRSHALRRAVELLEEDPSRLVARAVFVHGFSDATGRACDLIAALLRFHAARVLIDEPPDPSTGEPLSAFASHLRCRLESWARVSREEFASGDLGVPRFIAAPGAEAEVRAVAVRIAALLRDGASPEGVGVVARDVAGYATPLRIHFKRLGVPFSGLEPVATGGAVARKLTALVAILRQRARCPADRWIDGLDGLGSLDGPGVREGQGGVVLARALRADLRLALRHLAVARLGQVCELTERDDRSLFGARGGVWLPARRGLEVGDEAAPAPESRVRDGAPGAAARSASCTARGAAQSGAAQFGAARRFLSGALLSAACDAAASALARLEAAASPAAVDTLACHAERVRELVSNDLGWQPDAPASELLFATLDSLVNDAPPVELGFDDFAYLLARNLATAGEEPLGGAGGGVQVLSVMEARARTFGHLFVLGMNRDVFPRGIREDPLLGDSLRRCLLDMLPDIPIKQRGYDEERHLFAQLLASSASVTLSWQSAADDGKARAPSTLVERLRWDSPDLVVESASPLHSAVGVAVPTPAHEHARRAALYGERDSLAGPFAVALEERAANAARSTGRAEARQLAAVRLALIREFDAPPAAGGLLGPYFGFVGRPLDARDPRLARPYVTALEQLARCPWKSFLERTLRIEPVPDPIEALPEVDAQLVGSVVHRVLERMVREVLPEPTEDLATLVDGGPGAVSLAWPGDPEAFAMLRQEALQLLGEQGLALAGLVAVLVAQAWPRLECARDLEWPTPDAKIAVVGVEVEGRVCLPAGSRRDWSADSPRSNEAASSVQSSASPESIHFRADRVDRVDGALVLTDYKTGRPLSDAVRPATRRKHFEAAVRRGYQLQAVAYALSEPGGAAVGRYLHLIPDGQADKLEYRVTADDAELREAFERAARALLAARREGSFAPRLVEPDGDREPALCSRCNVAEACLRGDSGARRRLADWGEWAASGAPDRATRAEAALRDLWGLGAAAGEAAS